MDVLIINETEKYIMNIQDTCNEFGFGIMILKKLIENGESFNGYYFDWIEENND